MARRAADETPTLYYSDPTQRRRVHKLKTVSRLFLHRAYCIPGLPHVHKCDNIIFWEKNAHASLRGRPSSHTQNERGRCALCSWLIFSFCHHFPHFHPPVGVWNLVFISLFYTLVDHCIVSPCSQAHSGEVSPCSIAWVYVYNCVGGCVCVILQWLHTIHRCRQRGKPCLVPGEVRVRACLPLMQNEIELSSVCNPVQMRIT